MSNVRYKLLDVEKNMKFQFLFVTASKYGADWHSMMHTHPFTEIFYVTKGAGTFVTETETFSIKENDLVIVSPNVAHTERSVDNNPLEYIAVGVKNVSFTSTDHPDQSVTFFNFQDHKKEVLFYLNALISEAQERRENHETICQDLLEILLINILRNKKLSLEEVHTSRISKEISSVCQYIRYHYKENLTLEDLSELAHVNRYYLSHSFKKILGMSPIEYLNKVRIREAKDLLLTTNYAISQISQIVGFSNQSYFSEVFKQTEKVTPSAYRKSAKVND